jgi:hypothetical protein
MAKRRRMERHSRHELERPFVALPLSLVGGVAFNALGLTARRALDRLIAEHLLHAGEENGRLKVSYRQLATWTGANEGNISPALAEIVDLGLLVICKDERVAGSVKQPANLYRLTFLPDHEGAAPTDEWRRWEPSDRTDDEAWRAAPLRARLAAQKARQRRVLGKPAFRTAAESETAVASAEEVLKRTGRDKKIGRPGNKQTRAALCEVNVIQEATFRPTRNGVGPPHAEWGGRATFRPTRNGVNARPTRNGASYTSLLLEEPGRREEAEP